MICTAAEFVIYLTVMKRLSVRVGIMIRRTPVYVVLSESNDSFRTAKSRKQLYYLWLRLSVIHVSVEESKDA